MLPATTWVFPYIDSYTTTARMLITSLTRLPSAQPARGQRARSLGPVEIGTKVGQDRIGHRTDGGGDRCRQARCPGSGRPPRSRARSGAPGIRSSASGQPDRVVEAEARASWPPVPSAGPAASTTKRWTCPGLRRLGADRVDDHGQRRPGPGLDQPGGLAVGDRPGGRRAAPGHAAGRRPRARRRRRGGTRCRRRSPRPARVGMKGRAET